MALPPSDILALLSHVALLFSRRTWQHAPLRISGALLAPGRRMVSSALRAIGLGQTPTCQIDHRVLKRAVWSSRDASRILFGLLLATFAADGPLVVGIEETIERRRGRKISAAGILRDPVRPSRSHARQSARRALDGRHAAGSHSLGCPCLGAAFFQHTGPL